MHRLQDDDGGMCEGPSRISGPIPPDPTLCPDYYRRPSSGEFKGVKAAWQGSGPAPPLTPHSAPSGLSAQGRLEGNALKLDLLTPDTDRDLDATPPRAPRIRPGGLEILERGRRGVGGVLLQLGGISLGPGASPKSKFWSERTARWL